MNVSLSLQQYPEKVQEIIRVLNVNNGIPIPDLCKEVQEIFASSDLSTIQRFTIATDEEREAFRWKYAGSVLWKHNAHRPPQSDVKLIYIGHGGLRVSGKGGKPYCNIFFLARDRHDQPALSRGMARGEMADVYKKLAMRTQYDARIGKFKAGDDYFIDNRTTFLNPTLVQDITYEKLNSLLNITPVKVENAVDYPSKKTGGTRKFTDDTDWRCVLGYFDREPRYFTKKDETKGAVFNIIDETVMDRGTIDERGNVTGGLTAWIAPEHLVYDPDTWCAFYGPINVSKDKETGSLSPSMNCYCIMPLWGAYAPMEEREE